MTLNLLSQLTHVEVYATDVEESVRFYEDQIGLRVLRRVGDTVYLRAWGDHYPYSLVLSPGETSGMKRMAWRTTSAEALEEAVARIEAAGHPGAWAEPAEGIGRSYSFVGPYGHTMELFWEIERHRAPAELASQYPDRPEKRSLHGVAPRHFDHVTVAASDVKGFAKWYSDVLGFRRMAFAGFDAAGRKITFFGVLTTNEKSHDLGILLDSSDTPGRVHHYAYWVETREDLIRAADILIELGTPMEYGPGVHGIGEQEFLYFRDPSGVRIEVNTGGYRNYIPDWEPNDWTAEQGADDFFRNRTLPQSMLEAFPPAPKPTATEQGVVPGTEQDLIAAAALHSRNPDS